jgi:hypothetical protein
MLASDRSLRVPTQIGIRDFSSFAGLKGILFVEEWQCIKATEHQECHLVFERESSKEVPY